MFWFFDLQTTILSLSPGSFILLHIMLGLCQCTIGLKSNTMHDVHDDDEDDNSYRVTIRYDYSMQVIHVMPFFFLHSADGYGLAGNLEM